MLIDYQIDAHDLLKQLALKHVQRCDHLLEVGAGIGDLLHQLSNIYQAEALGIDPYVSGRSEGLVAFQSLPAEEIGKLKKRFDLVYTVLSFHHFSDPRKFFKELENVLGWDGTFILVDWKRGTYTGVSETYFDIDKVISWISNYNFRIVDKGTTPEHFFIVAVLRTKKLAVSTNNGITIFPGMFGQSPYFDIYGYQEEIGFQFKERRNNIYQKTLQHLKTLDVYAEVADCQALLASHIGKRGVQKLQKMGVKVFFQKGDIEKALKNVSKAE